MVIITRTQTTQSKSGMAAKDSWEKSILTSIFTHTRKRASHQWVSYIPRLHFGIGWFAFEVEHSIRLLHLCFFFSTPFHQRCLVEPYMRAFFFIPIFDFVII